MIRFRRSRCTILAGVLVISILTGAGCSRSETTKKERRNSDKNKTEETDIDPEETSDKAEELPDGESEETEDTEDPTGDHKDPTDAASDPTEEKSGNSEKEEALALAESLNIKEEDLRGEYALFLKYAEHVQKNGNLNGYENYILRLFPVVADHLRPENEDFFFDRVDSLRFEVGKTATPSGGEYYSYDNKVIINELGSQEMSASDYSLFFHELMHFIDFSIGGYQTDYIYCTKNGIKYMQEMTEEDWDGCILMDTSSFITEGGADYYDGKYFRKNMEGYYVTSILTGIEWIYGSDVVDELFFSSDSDMLFIRLLQEIGYTDQKILNTFDSFNAYTNSFYDFPEDPVRIEDVLIDMYEYKKGPSWKEDQAFMQILNEINAWTIDGAALAHEELEGVLLNYPQMEEWTKSLAAKTNSGNEPEPLRILKLFIVDGKPYLAVDLNVSIDFNREEPISLILDYDFETGEIRSFEYFVPDYPELKG